MENRHPVGMGLLAIAWMAFIASMFLPVWYYDYRAERGQNYYEGWIVFLIGWMGTLTCSPFYFGWWANPIMFCSLKFILVRQHRWAFIGGSIGLGVAMPNVFMKKIEVYTAGDFDILAYGPGYFLWFFAIAMNFVCSLVLYLLCKPPVLNEKLIISK